MIFFKQLGYSGISSISYLVYTGLAEEKNIIDRDLATRGLLIELHSPNYHSSNSSNSSGSVSSSGDGGRLAAAK